MGKQRQTKVPCTTTAYTKLVFFIITLVILGSSGTVVNAQTTSDQGQLLVYSNTSWQGSAGLGLNSKSISGQADQSYSFTCPTDQFLVVTIQKNTDYGYLVINIIQDGKILNVGSTDSPYGIVTLTTYCHQQQVSGFDNGILSISTDKDSYQYGDTINISAAVEIPGKGDKIGVTISNPAGEIIQSRDASDLTPYSESIVATGTLWKSTGTYHITANYGSFKIIKNIQIAQSPSQPASPNVQIRIDKQAYGHGETISVIGMINDLTSDNHVDLQIIDPQGTPVWSQTVLVKNDGTFVGSTSIDTQWVAGTYTINANYQSSGDSAKITFVLSSPQGANIPQSMASSQSVTAIPALVKNTAKWWSEGKIGDSDFIQGIQYLIQNGLMKVSHSNDHISNSPQKSIPGWIKNNAKWWSSNQITDDEFVKGIQYLISNGIMKI